MENTYESSIYEYNNATYNITDTIEVHNLLKNDSSFFIEYITKNTSAPELISIAENNTDKENFIWTVQSTKLFLQAYSNIKEKFRDPKMKKKQLWNKLVQSMREYGYSVDEEILDRKMRNMKRSYKTIKENNKKSTTGRGRVSWEYYDTFEEIFADDRTINHGPTLQSTLTTTSSTSDILNPEPSNLPCQQQTIENEIAQNSPISNTNLVANLLTSCTPPLSNAETFQSITSTDNFTPVSSLSRPLSAMSGNSMPSPSTNTNSTNNSKSVYNLRKRQLDIEEKRVDAINKLKESLDESNKIQQERNDLIKQLLLSHLDPNKP